MLVDRSMGQGRRTGEMMGGRVLLVLIGISAAALAQQKANPPEQPIPYSHKQHIALGLTCKDCHTNPDPGDAFPRRRNA